MGLIFGGLIFGGGGLIFVGGLILGMRCVLVHVVGLYMGGAYIERISLIFDYY